MYHINPNRPKTVYVGPIQRTDKDHWRLENGHLVRVHRKWRKALFEPREQRDMPISFEKLLGQRTTTIEYEDGHVEVINDDWLTSLNPTRCAPRGLWWRGTTKIRHKPLIDEPITRRQPMSTTSANHETQDQSSTPLISEHVRDYMGKRRRQMETTPRQTTFTTLPTRSRTTTKVNRDHQRR